MSDKIETTPTPEEYPVYELIVSFIPRQQALVRIAAPDEKTARTAVTEMATETAEDLRIESCIEVPKDAPIPQDYEEEGQQVEAPAKKRYH